MKLTYHPKTAVDSSTLQKYKDFALELAALGGKAALPYFRSAYDLENKLQGIDFDPVTTADKSAESVIRKAIESRFPSHGILGEEQGFKGGDGLTWVIDPIDGTRAFINGMLHWGVLVALFDGETPLVGVMYQPFTDEFFVGDNTSAEYIRGSKSEVLTIRNCPTIRDAVLASTGPQFFQSGDEQNGFARLEQQVKTLRYGGDCYLYCMLAMGQIDLVVEAGLNTYDIQALIPIIKGAGGFVSTWGGDNPSMGGQIIAAGDERVFELALSLLQGY